MRDQLRTLDVKLALARKEVVEGEPDEITDSVIDGLMRLSGRLPMETPMALRRIVNVLVKEILVDPLTNEAWLTLRLPNWAMDRVGSFSDKVCLDPAILQNCGVETNSLLLAEAHLWYTKNKNSRFSHKHMNDWKYEVTDGIFTSKQPKSPKPLPPTLKEALAVRPHDDQGEAAKGSHCNNVKVMRGQLAPFPAPFVSHTSLTMEGPQSPPAATTEAKAMMPKKMRGRPRKLRAAA